MNIEFHDHSGDVMAAFDRAKNNALTAIGMTAEGYAKEKITSAKAVVTGRLRNSISHAEEEDSTYIGTNVEYALGIETGTHRRAGAVHYLQDAATGHSSEYKKLAEDAMKNA